jgi:DIS3-like exonuclease 1
VATVQSEEGAAAGGGGGGMEAVLVVPMDVRIPKIRVRTRHAREITDQRLVIAIDEWDADSMYPNGHVVRQLGRTGELETEIQAILVENGLASAALPFAASIMAALPSADTWHVPDEEVRTRTRTRTRTRARARARTRWCLRCVGCAD